MTKRDDFTHLRPSNADLPGCLLSIIYCLAALLGGLLWLLWRS
jgi:hypothetical protein